MHFAPNVIIADELNARRSVANRQQERDDGDVDDNESPRQWRSSLCASFGEVMVRQCAETESQQTLAAARWRTNERASKRTGQSASYPTGQLTNPPNVTPTTEPGSSAELVADFAPASPSFPLPSRSRSPARPSKNNSRSLFIARLSCVTLPRDRFTIDVNEPRRFPKVPGHLISR